jgi:hypothetical protein
MGNSQKPVMSRRRLIQAGSLSLAGLTLHELLRCETLAHSAGATSNAGFGRAKSCIVLFLKGGPPQQDTFDPKPHAPAEIRGEFGVIRTSAPGVYFSDQLPYLAKQAHRCTILRTLSHTDSTHSTAAFLVTTGRPFARPGEAVASRDDAPHFGSMVAAYDRSGRDALSFVMTPDQFVVNGEIRGGQGGGMLGPRYDPLLPGGDPNLPDYHASIFASQAPVDHALLQSRRALLQSLDRGLNGAEPTVHALDTMQQKALSILERGVAKAAFEVESEATELRERYGRSTFGQSVLMARRLVEAGVRLVQVNCMSSVRDLERNWDLHKNNFSTLRDILLPNTDRAVAALLEDLAQTGQLAETLVVMLGEFGRTPKINEQAGRDHWPQAQSVLLAGAGVHEGAVYGATDAHAAYPVSDAVTPAQIVATILHALGVPPDTRLTTRDGRPFKACDEKPVLKLWNG